MDTNPKEGKMSTGNGYYSDQVQETFTAFRAFLPKGLVLVEDIVPEVGPPSMQIVEQVPLLRRLVSISNPPSIAAFYKQSEPPDTWTLAVWGAKPNIKWGTALKDAARRFESASQIKIEFRMAE